MPRGAQPEQPEATRNRERGEDCEPWTLTPASTAACGSFCYDINIAAYPHPALRATFSRKREKGFARHPA